MRREEAPGRGFSFERETGGRGQPYTEVDRLVRQIGTLADSAEARALLGVDGVLTNQVELAFLNDPYEWISNDLAAAVRDFYDDAESGSTDTPMLATLVAEYRLCLLLLGRVDDAELVSRVRGYLQR